jgi:hypothetical protein
MKPYFISICLSIALNLFAENTVNEALFQKEKITPKFSILGEWKVIKASADFSYLGNHQYSISQKEIDTENEHIEKEEVGATIYFKKDSIISNLFGSEIFSQVLYAYRVMDTKKYLEENNYDEDYLPDYKSKTIEIVTTSYYNSYLSNRDTVYSTFEKINDHLIHANFGAKDMYLSKVR